MRNDVVNTSNVHMKKIIDDGVQYLAIKGGDEVDQLVSILGHVVVRAQNLSDENRRRMMGFMSSAYEALRLSPSDRRVFEREIHSSRLHLGEKK